MQRMEAKAAETFREDVLVVGSGPVGATFARKLVLAGRSVCVVEAGDYLSERPGENMKNRPLYRHDDSGFQSFWLGHVTILSVPTQFTGPLNTDPEADQPHTDDDKSTRFQLNNLNPEQDAGVNLEGAAVSYAVGGMGTHWTCTTPRQHPTVERSNIIPDEEWNTLYAEAEKLLMTRDDSFQHSIRNTIFKEALQTEYCELKGAASPQNLPVAGYRLLENPDVMHWTGTDDVLGPLLDDPALRSHFSIKPQHLVEKLVFNADRNALEYAVVRNLREDRFIHVYASQFVVAAGAILTPQILFNSGHRPHALGRYLTEQHFAKGRVVVKRNLIERCRTDERVAAQVNAHVKNHSADPRPDSNDLYPQLYIPVSEGRPWQGKIQRCSVLGSVPPDVDSRIVVEFVWFGKTEQHEDNYVTFSENITDGMGMPQPTFHCVLSDEDKELKDRMMQDLLRAASAVGEFLPEARPAFFPPGSALHATGTIRMGKKNDGKSVVDEFSKVWDVNNLYLGGNGVIPTGTACNPTLTSVALAIRAANKMSQDASVTKHGGQRQQ